MSKKITSVRVFLVNLEDLVNNEELLTKYNRGDYSGLQRDEYLVYGYTPILVRNEVANTLDNIVSEWNNYNADWFHNVPRCPRNGDIIEVTVAENNRDYYPSTNITVSSYGINYVTENSRCGFYPIYKETWNTTGIFS